MHWSAKLRALGACEDAVNYARAFDSFVAAWAACERGDWLLWILGRLSGPPGSDSRRAVVAAAVDCAALARKLTSGSTRRAFDHCQRTTRRYLRGEATIGQVRAAAQAAADAADDAYDAAAYAADAAAYEVAGDAANAAYAYDARASALRRCAKIVRKHFPNPPTI